MSANPPMADGTLTPESRFARLKRLADENLADALIVEPARKRMKARETETRALLQIKDVEKPPQAAQSVVVIQDKTPPTGLLKLLLAFKKTPLFGNRLFCVSCTKEDLSQPILTSCLHISCTPCFIVKINAFLNNDGGDFKTPTCYESHQGRYKQVVNEGEIDSYVELDPQELRQLKRMVKGGAIDLRKMASLHEPKPGKELRSQWQKLVSRRRC